MNIPNATEFLTVKWLILILCFVNFISIKFFFKNKKKQKTNRMVNAFINSSHMVTKVLGLVLPLTGREDAKLTLWASVSSSVK